MGRRSEAGCQSHLLQHATHLPLGQMVTERAGLSNVNQPDRSASRRLIRLAACAASAKPCAACICCPGCQLSTQTLLQGSQGCVAEGLGRLQGRERKPACSNLLMSNRRNTRLAIKEGDINTQKHKQSLCKSLPFQVQSTVLPKAAQDLLSPTVWLAPYQ